MDGLPTAPEEPMMKPHCASLLLVCAASAGASAAPADPVRDHDTIVRMQGEYTVDFAFDETVLLQPGYARAPAMRSGGNELVVVVEDTPTRIVLQHLLVDPASGHVTKHWRQDWTYEAPVRFEFSADQTWRVRPLPADLTRGAWTQCVYEVSDAPRYCGTGRWRYDNGVPSWTSDPGWRPLPRREYTRRSDYNALAMVNRHTLTPDGWTHEQFNTKVRRDPDGGQHEIAREFGFNDYVRSTDVDFSPARDYWNATAGYWARVRGYWERFLAQAPGVRMKTPVDGMAMIVPLFTQAEAVQAGRAVDARQIGEVFAAWVEKAPAAD
ncbi:exported protein [Stenotrophomonas acidaminiphila]|uniref:Exported protein n=2 Tax=Stenotrophomonas acidaminiphila TaxID=128780 RepID=A0A0S1B2N3_9GAMM|nr:exported protein [Stenotrophomonas acidaminiphila]